MLWFCLIDEGCFSLDVHAGLHPSVKIFLVEENASVGRTAVRNVIFAHQFIQVARGDAKIQGCILYRKRALQINIVLNNF